MRHFDVIDAFRPPDQWCYIGGGGGQQSTQTSEFPPEFRPIAVGAGEQILAAQEANPLTNFTIDRPREIAGFSPFQQALGQLLPQLFAPTQGQQDANQLQNAFSALQGRTFGQGAPTSGANAAIDVLNRSGRINAAPLQGCPTQGQVQNFAGGLPGAPAPFQSVIPGLTGAPPPTPSVSSGGVGPGGTTGGLSPQAVTQLIQTQLNPFQQQLDSVQGGQIPALQNLVMQSQQAQIPAFGQGFIDSQGVAHPDVAGNIPPS